MAFWVQLQIIYFVVKKQMAIWEQFKNGRIP